MKKNLILAVMLFALLAFAFPIVGHAAVPTSTESLGVVGVYKINEATPGLKEIGLGTRLEGPLKRETTTYTTGGIKTFDVDDAVILFTTDGAAGTNDPSLADSKPGHLMTFVLTTDGGTDVDITPETKSGFTSITLDSANDSCTLRYQDDTVGWVYAGGNSCTVN